MTIQKLPIYVEVPTPDTSAIEQQIAEIASQLQSHDVRLAALEAGVVPEPDKYDYEALLNHPDLIDAISFRDQSVIDSRSFKVRNNASGTNENIIYDSSEDAGRLFVASSLRLYNRVAISFPIVSTGVLTCVWDYKPSSEWGGNGGNVRTHKMFMTGSTAVSDSRAIEQRFHYDLYGFNSQAEWQVDTRPYGLGTSEGLLGKIVPHNETEVPADQWVQFVSVVDFTKPDPGYSLTASGMPVYENVPLPALLQHKQGLTFFDPTWCNTSQDTHAEPPRTHGWLRNAVVLWKQ